VASADYHIGDLGTRMRCDATINSHYDRVFEKIRNFKFCPLAIRRAYNAGLRLLENDQHERFMREQNVSPLYVCAADALIRARRLPVGPARNDLRQIAIGLRWLEKKGFAFKVQDRFEEEADARTSLG
jgi:hypothetical protein